jgi:hypothetical protein
MGFFSKRSIVQRIEERRPTFGFLEVRSEGGAPLAQATLRDTSRFGAMIRSQSERELPGRVNLWFPKEQIDIGASVRWIVGEDFGVQFDHALEIWNAAKPRRNRIDVVTSHLEKAGI